MQIYDPKKWFEILFQFHQQDTLRKLLPLIGIISLYAGIIVFAEEHLFPADNWPYLKNVSQLHTLLGFVMSLLLVFRTNTAYDRWWEGRRLWGALVNNSRNLAIKLEAMLPPHDHYTRAFFNKTIPLYADVLRSHLQAESTRLMLDTAAHPELELDHSKHVPNQVAKLMVDRIVRLYREQKISGDELIVLNGELSSFTDICGACERIKNTPIPYSYSSFIKKFIFIYVMTLPFGYVYTLSYLLIPVVATVFYVLTSLELIAEEIEDPFGTDANDLPMDKIAANIRRHVGEIL